MSSATITENERAPPHDMFSKLAYIAVATPPKLLSFLTKLGGVGDRFGAAIRSVPLTPPLQTEKQNVLVQRCANVGYKTHAGTAWADSYYVLD